MSIDKDKLVWSRNQVQLVLENLERAESLFRKEASLARHGMCIELQAALDELNVLLRDKKYVPLYLRG